MWRELKEEGGVKEVGGKEKLPMKMGLTTFKWKDNNVYSMK